MSPLHRDGDDDDPAPTWESLTDRLIREAQERGEWDTSAWNGKRLPAQDGVYEDELAGAHTIVRNAGAAPPWIETDREARRLLAERDRLRAATMQAPPGVRLAARRRYEELLRTLDATLRRLEIEAPTPELQRGRIDVAADLAELDRLLASE